jgi:hypothetical protein
MKELKNLLIEKWQYDPKTIDEHLDSFQKLDESIMSAFITFVDTEKYPEIPVFSNCHVKKLSETYQMKPPAYFLLLDWIRREPVEAFSALQDEFGILPD